MEEKILVNLGKNSYPIYLGRNILLQDILKKEKIYFKNFLIITNTIVEKNFLTTFIKKVKNFSIEKNLFVLPDGEIFKNITIVNKIISFLLENSFGRDTTLLALGGGVIGDITGFVASIYQRGINYIQIPTTLLAQVDSSIGGKTGVNHKLGKNMIGTFFQPKSVWINLQFLYTLPSSQLLSGIAEIIKYSIILDEGFFIWLEKNIFNIINLKEKNLLYCIQKSAEFKAQIVEKDEKEKNIRAILNLGHSFGHAIENYMGYGKWLHGYAVAAGISMASRLSYNLGFLKRSYLTRILKLFSKIGLPILGPSSMCSKDYLPIMLRDKKVIEHGKIRLILPISLGKVSIFDNIKKEFLLKSIDPNIN